MRADVRGVNRSALAGLVAAVLVAGCGDSPSEPDETRDAPDLESFRDIAGGWAAVWIAPDGVEDFAPGQTFIGVSYGGTQSVHGSIGQTDLDASRREYRFAELAGNPSPVLATLSHQDQDGNQARFECTPSWTCEEVPVGEGGGR